MLKVAVVGATGAVGRELLSILEQRKFPVGELLLFASPRSEGRVISWGGRDYRCQVLRKSCFDGVQIAFFDASDAVSKEWVPQAVSSGARVIDNSATFRLDDDVSLVIPEVNGHLVKVADKIIAGPNCSTAQLVMALKPIHDGWGLKRVVVSTYQSTSGAGAAAMLELSAQTKSALEGAHTGGVAGVFPHPIAFNAIPHIGRFSEDGYTSEEQKIMQETRKLLGLSTLKVSATAVRIPTYSCHAESVNIECERAFDLKEVRQALTAFQGIMVEDDPGKNVYPMGLLSKGKDAVYVGRLRRDPSVENGLNLWVVSDNLRKGAALNAVQIGELLLKNFQ